MYACESFVISFVDLDHNEPGNKGRHSYKIQGEMGMCPVYFLLLSVGGLKDEDGLGQEKNSCRV